MPKSARDTILEAGERLAALDAFAVKMYFTGPEITAVRFKKAPRQDGHFYRWGQKMPVKKTATEIMVYVENMGWRRVHTTEGGRFYAIVNRRRAYIRSEDMQSIREYVNA